MSSNIFEIAKREYEAGRWHKSRIAQLVKAGKLTAAQYAEIVDEEYAE